jgi:hypothetical protein
MKPDNVGEFPNLWMDKRTAILAVNRRRKLKMLWTGEEVELATNRASL